MNVVVLGAGGHAKVVIDIIENDSDLHLVGLIAPILPIGATVAGYSVLGCDEDLPAILEAANVEGAVLAVGDNWTRGQLAHSLCRRVPALAFPPVVHPAACIARSARVGRGTVVMAGCVINSEAVVGEYCIVNTCASVDHETVIEDFASLAPKACAGGKVRIGSYTAVGLGANLIHRVTVGPHSVVGAGSTVLRDLPPNVVAYGTPARVIRQRTIDEKYL